MHLSSVARILTRLPSRVAFLLGVAAVSVGGAKADASAANPTPDPAKGGLGELCLWGANGEVYLAEPDRPARQLVLGDTSEARRLRALLDQHGATNPRSGVRLDRMLLAGAGGEGIDWARPTRTRGANRPVTDPVPATDPAGAKSHSPASQTGAQAPRTTVHAPRERDAGQH